MIRLLAAFIIGTVSLRAAPTPTTALPFSDAIEKIIKRNPSVEKQRATVEATRASNLSTKLSYLPTLSLQARHTSSRSLGTSLTSTRRELGGTASLNIFKFGADSAAINAAKADIQTQESLLEQAILTAEADAISALSSMIQFKKEVAVLKQILQTRKDALKIAKKRFKKGFLASQEVDAISIDLANAEAQLKDSEVSLIDAEANLQKFLGHTNINVTWPWKSTFELSPPQILKRKNPDLSHRPDFAAAKSTLSSKTEKADEAWGTIFPSLDAGFFYGYAQTETPGFSPTSGPEFSGTLTLTIPLFDRLSNYGNYQAAIHQRTASEMELERIRREAKKEWQSARGSLKVSLQSTKTRDKTLKISRKLYQTNFKRFNRGLINANEFRVDQDRLYQSELFAIRGWKTVHDHFTQLCHSLGMRVKKCLQHKETK